jgi:di/tricarboxylate transporter
MRALEELGLIKFIGNQLSHIISQIPEQYRLLVAVLVILWVSSIASAFIEYVSFFLREISYQRKTSNIFSEKIFKTLP